MPANFDFEELHFAIQDAFGWEGNHMHQFFTGNPYSHSRKRNYKIISLPHPERYPEEIDEQVTRLYQWLKKPKMQFITNMTLVTVGCTKSSWKRFWILPPKKEYPILLDGANAAPPEDCGGDWGYINLVAAIKDSKNPEHADMLDWLGLDKPEDFDPEHFDKDEVEFRVGRKIK